MAQPFSQNSPSLQPPGDLREANSLSRRDRVFWAFSGSLTAPPRPPICVSRLRPRRTQSPAGNRDSHSALQACRRLLIPESLQRKCVWENKFHFRGSRAQDWSANPARANRTSRHVKTQQGEVPSPQARYGGSSPQAAQGQDRALHPYRPSYLCS